HEPPPGRPERDVVGLRARPHLQEHLLQDFLGLAAVAKDPQDQAEQQAVVAIVQLPHRGLVSGDDPIEQRDVVAGTLPRPHLHGQYAASFRSAAAIVSAFGRFAASSTCENGTWVSGYVTRITGASNDSKRSSIITADSSAPRPSVFTSSWTISTRLVFSTDAN